jgi:rSAM/selenodomain-associated transferase 1
VGYGIYIFAEREKKTMADALVLFAMIPTAGKTKVRLMPFLSAEECAKLYGCFAKDVYQKAVKSGADVYVFFTPRDKAGVLRELLGERVVLLPQHGDNLGEKMRNAIGAVLRLGYDKVVLMGMDIPHIHTETMINAFNSLDTKDIVIHPALDGGYYLIGMKREYESIWDIKRYGTNTVMYDTLQKMKKENLSIAVGQMYYDVDCKEDLKQLWNDIKHGAVCNCPETESCLETLRQKLESSRVREHRK